MSMVGGNNEGHIEAVPPFIVGGKEFGITEDLVQEVADALRPIAEGKVEAIMKQEDAQKRLELFTSQSAPAIIAEMKKVYEKVRELESDRETKDDLIATIRREFPDLMNYYDLLRKAPAGWGYRLGQAIGAARMKEEEAT